MEWKPIETFPDDTETVLLCWNNRVKTGWKNYSGKWKTDQIHEPKGQPTHWMPLPEPPNA